MNTKPEYPVAFLSRMKEKLGDDYSTFLESMEQPPPVSVRLNPFKKNSEFDNDEKVPWCGNGRYLKERPSFTFDPLFHAGTYYVQEASSMFIEQAWKQINPQNKPVRVLDMCAAPGGKSTHLLSLMNEESLLVSNEIIPSRNKILRQNVIKWGAANCVVTQNKTEDFTALQNYFDIILIDAPCSGEGLFRKDKEAMNEWSEKNVAMCSVRQKEILKHAVECLKPGGFLIYSTCTFEEEENDKPIADCGLRIADLKIQNFELTKTKYGFQFYPHKVRGEGFYISVLQKQENGSVNKKLQTPKLNYQLLNINREFLREAEGFCSYAKNEFLFAIPKSIYSDFLFLEKPLYIRHAGIFMGAMKGKDFLPSHDLALSNDIKRDLPAVDLSYDESISYLRCETPKVKTETRGWALARYKDVNLGWMKILDGRINNYFPKDWRILKR